LLLQSVGADEYLVMDNGVVDSLFDTTGFVAEESPVISGHDDSNFIWVQYLATADQNVFVTKTVAKDYYPMVIADTITGFAGGLNLYRGIVDLSASAPGTSVRWKSDSVAAVEAISLVWR